MFENLSEKLEKAFKNISGKSRLSEINIATTVKEIRRALVEADVDFKTAKEFTNRVKDKAIGQNVLTSLQPSQLMIKITHDELTKLMGSESSKLNINGKPSIILMAGLQGSGKTTHSAKLAKYIKETYNKKVLLVACDVYRPAAIDQLHVMGEKVNVEVFSDKNDNNPISIAKKALAYAKANHFTQIIVDTAGRLSIDEKMMDEIYNLKKELNPNEILFVIDAMTGQDAVNTAKAFNDILNFDGVILTKLDSDTRGGAALTIKSVVEKPIKFVGTGEKVDALEIFHPERMADRILGKGDVVSLVEKIQKQYDENEAKKLQEKINKNKFDFQDFYNQLQQIKKMGNLKDLMGMIPGVGKAIKNIDIDDNSFKSIEAIIQSMTPEERKNPKLLNASRKLRISNGSGTKVQDLNKLIDQFNQTSKMMQMMNKNKGMMNMMRFMK